MKGNTLKKLPQGIKRWSSSFTLRPADVQGLPPGMLSTAIYCIVEGWITLHRFQLPEYAQDVGVIIPGEKTLAVRIFTMPIAWRHVLYPNGSATVRFILRQWREQVFPVLFSAKQVRSRSRVTREARGIFLGLDIYTKETLSYNISRQVEQYKLGGSMASFVGTPLQQAEMEAAKLTGVKPQATSTEEPPPVAQETVKKNKGGRPKGTKNKPKGEVMTDIGNQATAAGGINLGVGLQPGIVNKEQVTAATGETPPAAGMTGLTLGDLAHGNGNGAQTPLANPAAFPETGTGEKIQKLAEGLGKLQSLFFDEFKLAAEKNNEHFLDLENKVQEMSRNINLRLTAQTDILQEILNRFKEGGLPAAPAAIQTPPAAATPPVTNLPDQPDKFPQQFWDMLLQPSSWPAAPVEIEKIATVLIPQLRNNGVEMTVEELKYSFLKKGVLDPQTLRTIPMGNK